MTLVLSSSHNMYDELRSKIFNFDLLLILSYLWWSVGISPKDSKSTPNSRMAKDSQFLTVTLFSSSIGKAGGSTSSATTTIDMVSLTPSPKIIVMPRSLTLSIPTMTMIPMSESSEDLESMTAMMSWIIRNTMLNRWSCLIVWRVILRVRWGCTLRMCTIWRSMGSCWTTLGIK